MAISYTMELQGLDALVGRWETLPAEMKATITSTLMKSAVQVQAIVKEEAPVRTGRLKSAIQIIPISATTVEIKANTNYAEYVERGTGVYGPNRTPIVSPRGNIMWTRTDPGFGKPNARGYWFLGRSVQGQKSNPFMKRAYDRSKPIIETQFKAMLAAITEEL